MEAGKKCRDFDWILEIEPKDPSNDLLMDVGRRNRAIGKPVMTKNTDFPELVQKSHKMNK